MPLPAAPPRPRLSSSGCCSGTHSTALQRARLHTANFMNAGRPFRCPAAEQRRAEWRGPGPGWARERAALSATGTCRKIACAIPPCALQALPPRQRAVAAAARKQQQKQPPQQQQGKGFGAPAPSTQPLAAETATCQLAGSRRLVFPQSARPGPGWVTARCQGAGTPTHI